MEFFEVLKRELRERGWSMTRLAREVGVSKQSVSGWLSEDAFTRTVPQAATCEKIAGALGVDSDELLALAGHRRRREQEAESRVSYELLRRMERMQALMDAGYPKPLLLAVLDANISMAEANAAGPSLEREVKPVQGARIKPRTRPFPDDGSGADGSLTVPYPRESVAA